MAKQFIYPFTFGDKSQSDLLGGKGANIAEMVQMGLPVPPGFTITTEACREFLSSGTVPSNGPVIIASNHLSFSDSIFMPLVVPRNVTFLAKSEYFTSPGIKGFIKKITFIALGQVPVDRSGGKRSEAALLTGLKLLKEEHCIGIYPEGTRSPDGRLYKGRTGIARMAIESGAPIIPVAMYNTAEIQPTGQVVPKVRRVEMVFGA